MNANAVAQGWGANYSDNEDFRKVFDAMDAAVANLPTELLQRGQSYPFPQLHNACLAGDIQIVKALLQHPEIGGDTYPCTDDECDEPPLVWLAQKEDMDPKLKIQVAKVLLANGADIDEGRALEHAQDAGDVAFEEFLINQGAT